MVAFCIDVEIISLYKHLIKFRHSYWGLTLFYLSLIGIILRWGFLIWELIFIKAVITGDTVTRLSIPIRGRGKSPEEGQRWNMAETLWKKKQHKNYQDEDKKSAINKN